MKTYPGPRPIERIYIAILAAGYVITIHSGVARGRRALAREAVLEGLSLTPNMLLKKSVIGVGATAGVITGVPVLLLAGAAASALPTGAASYLAATVALGLLSFSLVQCVRYVAVTREWSRWERAGKPDGWRSLRWDRPNSADLAAWLALWAALILSLRP